MSSPALKTFLDAPESRRRIGPFQLVRQLGRGGFAPVWLAREVYESTEVRQVALKLFAFEAAPVSSSPASGVRRTQAREGIVREARALCRVEHPNVVRFLQIAVDDDRGVVGLAMEYVDGESLEQKLVQSNDGKLPYRAVVEAGLAVANALAAVHGAGLVHRDVKPANVVRATRISTTTPNGADAELVWKLIDFGIAAADAPLPEKRKKRFVLDDVPLEVAGSKMSMLVTMDGDGDEAKEGEGAGVLASGTVGYMDPISVSTGASATPASDLYSLGALLFECATGVLPAVAASMQGRARGMKGEVLDGREPPPSLRLLADDAPAPLVSLVDALLRPERDTRPKSATEVVRALESLRAGMSSISAPLAATATIAPEPPLQKRRGGWMIAAALGLVLASLGGFVAVKRARAPHVCSMGDANDCSTQCDRGSATSCQILGAMYENGKGVPPDAVAARSLYTRGCDGGDALACFALASMVEHGHGGAADAAAAAALYDRSCTLGGMQACNALGVAYESGRGIERDPQRASSLYAKACDAGYPNGCSNLGLLYEHALGVTLDGAKARALYEKACGMGAPVACGNLANAYAAGLGGPVDLERAAKLFGSACESGYVFACQGLGLLYEQGEGVPKDGAKAASMYAGACEQGLISACGLEGLLYLNGTAVEKDAGKAFALLQRACEDGDGGGCTSLASMYATGEFVAKDETKAKSLYAKACAAGDSGSCATSSGAPMPSPTTMPPTASASVAPSASPSAEESIGVPTPHAMPNAVPRPAPTATSMPAKEPEPMDYE